jgi:anti-sigma regulatory factor (Ser/Thr protein kinase)
VWRGNRRRASPGHVEPELLLRQVPEPDLPVVGRPSLRLQIGPGLQHWRRPMAAALSSLGLPGGRPGEFLIAVSEVVANAVRHGRGRARLALWVTAERATCEVRDHGTGMDDPFAGYLPPGAEGAPGMGLGVARQLSDDLTIRSGPDGTTVRLAIGR